MSEDLPRKVVGLWPLFIGIVTVAGGWATFDARIAAIVVRSDDLSKRIEKFEVREEDIRRQLRQDLDGIRDSLGRQQLTLARICVLVSHGKECE